MNALFPQPASELLNLVSFKWLMAGRGWWVNLSRLQQDLDYARSCAQRGLESGHELLQERSAELLATLGEEACGTAAFELSNGVRII